MAHNANQGVTRSARALTLQTGAPAKEFKDSSSTAPEQQFHRRAHRHHRSQQITSRDVQSAIQSSGLQLADLLSPVRTTAGSWTGLGSKDASPSLAGSKTGSRNPSRERKKGDQRPRAMPKEWSWAQVKLERSRNQQRERTVSMAYAGVATAVRSQTQALDSLQSSIENTLASATKLLSQLRDLYQSSSRSLNSLTESSLPNLVQTSETHLAALQRAHVSNSISQLATLKARITSAREKTTTLQHRVEKCAQRVAVKEERERAELRSHKRRIGFFWAVFGLLIVMWIGVVVWREKPARAEQTDFEYDEIYRVNVELRDILRSKGVEWALEDGPLSSADESKQECPNGLKSDVSAWPSTAEIPRPSAPAELQLNERLQHMFDTL